MKKLLTSAAIIYLLLLTWVILFKANLNTIYFMFDPDLRGLSFVPYFNARETLLNVAAFIPFGVFAQLLHIRRPVLAAFGLSLFYEIMQYVLAVGTADVTDLISNTFGGVIGVLLISVYKRLIHCP